MNNDANVLGLFHPAVRRWFCESYADPTPPQTLGWPAIARGKNTLILAPTGSGKTLAAFLFAINDLVERHQREEILNGVQVLYLSPLKALAVDIERNLDRPLKGIQSVACGLGIDLPAVTIGVRTGDTSPAERQKMVRRPPQILITTPESLHLLLTSMRARTILQTVRTVIVDEIHAVCPNKRGTFLSLLLERLEDLVERPFVRIGLSATQRPLEAVAEFLAGYDDAGLPRPIEIIDAGMRKGLDLAVIAPVDDMTLLPRDEDGAPSIWPAIYEQLLELIASHRSTLIFANNRRSVERIAAELNKRAGHNLVCAHHGSVSKERRQQIEEDLKAGRLPALVATGSLELGIDMGAIDLVCQVESPHSVARGLQRVGRAGHVYRARSQGRLIPKTREDLLEMAALASAMHRGQISAVHIPKRPLDVLAQQVVAMVAVQERQVDDLLATVQRAAPYHDLSREALCSVLDMLAGGYPTHALSELKPRISWDRVNDRLYPLPGSRHVAIINGGAIPDTGQYPVLLEDGKTRLGELDEEFIYERREGETILLGTSRWQILEIGTDRVVVAPSEEKAAQMPFWRGEGLGRNVEFGRYFGSFLRECEARLSKEDFESWLTTECLLDKAAAYNVSSYLKDQIKQAGTIPNDRLILLDVFCDEFGEPRLALLSPFGRAFHLAFLFAALAAFRRAGQDVPLAVHSDAGILFKLGNISIDKAASILRSIRADDVEALIMEELEDSAFFGLHFRQNAARALLLPRLRPGRRTPLWLQRLRARDLLALARGYSSFPIVAETYREVIEDLLPIRELAAFLDAVTTGDAELLLRRGRRPTPFTSSLLFDFTALYLYEWDEPKRVAEESKVDRDAVLALLQKETTLHLFDPEALAVMEKRLQSLSLSDRARDGVELVELLRRIGDLTQDELEKRSEPKALAALPELLADGRIARVELSGCQAPMRLVAGEDFFRYEQFDQEDSRFVISRYITSHALVTREDILARYPVSEQLLERLLGGMELVEIAQSEGPPSFCNPDVAAGIRRLTLSQRRRRVKAAPPSAFSDFLLSFQHLRVPLDGLEGTREVLTQLAWLYLPLEVWPRVLRTRVRGYRKDHLDTLLRTGEFVWRGTAHGEGTKRIAFTARGQLQNFLAFSAEGEPADNDLANRVVATLREHGASFLNEIAAQQNAPPSQVAVALWNLVWSGQVTNDSLAPVWAGRPRKELWQPGRRRARGWVGAVGRWSAFPSVQGNIASEETETIAHRLLARFGLLCRETLGLEHSPIPWGSLYPVLSRLEWRGDVERGLFVSGLSGSQFALREATEELMRSQPTEQPVLLNTCDPANLYGASSPFPVRALGKETYALRRHPANFLVLQRGIPILAIENRGERLTPLVVLTRNDRRTALALLPQLISDISRSKSIRVKQWAGKPVGSSAVAQDLETLGFMYEDQELIYYRRYQQGEDA